MKVDRKDKQFGFAVEASKQMITLSTGIIALTVTLLKDVLNSADERPDSLLWAWIALGLSVGFGIFFLLSLTGQLADTKNVPDANLTIYERSATGFMWAQLITFLIGLALTIGFGESQLPPSKPSTKADSTASSSPRSTITKIRTIVPFLDGDTTLADSQWATVERAVRDSVRSFSGRSTVDGLLILGGVDQRSLSPKVAARFGSNRGLANARAQAASQRLERIVPATAGVFPVEAGALNVGRAARDIDWREDRRVDVFILARPLPSPSKDSADKRR